MEAMHWVFEMQLAAVEAQIRHGGGRNTGASAIVMMLPKLNRSMRWTVFHRQF